ncbi:MAG: zinc-binding dehydrogenase, partial [Actinomycetota bacterium]
VEPSAGRRALATRIGATDVVDPLDVDVYEALADLHGSRPLMGMPQPATEVYIEASGAAPVLRKVIGSAGPDARLVVVALHREDVPVSFLDVLMRELTIRGAMEYPDEFSRTVDLLTRTDLSALITDRFDLDDAEAAFALAESGESAGKILVDIT